MRAPAAWNRSEPLQKKTVVRRVLRTDPGQEYFVAVPSAGGHGAPLFVAVHGISRNAIEQAKMFSSFCEANGVVLVAPHFSAEKHSDYQRLGRAGRGDRADVVLNSIIEETSWLTGASTTQVYLFGYSGGAQFAHRYLMAYPHRVARAVIASAGWYTFPDRGKRFPYGIRPNRHLPSVRFDPEEFLRVPVAVLVGELDTTSVGLRRTARVDRQQGETRVERARNWVEAMQAAARAYRLDPQVSFEQMPGGDHSFKDLMKQSQLGERVFQALFGAPFTRS
jgi:poly(3-hydroxybutyrate) depolymerase